MITPVVVWGGNGALLRPNAAEVASVHRIPLADIARADAFDFVMIPESDRRVVRVRIDRLSSVTAIVRLSRFHAMPFTNAAW